MNCSNAVKSVWSVSRPSVALAMPKSMTLGTGTPSCSVTRVFEGLMSRWILDVDFRTVPMGGLVAATHRSTRWLRARQFAFVLAGPLVNLLLAAAAWPFLNVEQLWSVQPMEQGWQLGLAFFYANMAILFGNLWPLNVATAFGNFPSDGKQLFLTFFL